MTAPLAVSLLFILPTEQLTLGVNLSGWFWLPREQTEAHFRTHFGAQDARLLKNAGFTHVRMPLEPDVIFDGMTLKLKADRWGWVKDGAKLFQKEGLAVILDVHPVGKPLASPDGSEDRVRELAGLWDQIASNIADLDHSKLWLEVMNEPHNIKIEDWQKAQDRVVAAIRAKQPKLPLILTGVDWGNISGLLQVTSIPDKNALFTFHFYEPHSFTHQGATWGSRNWPFLKNLPYPATPERAAAALPGIADEEARKEVAWYGSERWNRDRISAQLDKAQAWAKQNDVRLYCGEFGVYAKAAPAADRLQWYRDVVGELRERKIGMAFWDYLGADSFGIAEGSVGARKLVPDILAIAQGKPVSGAKGASR